MAKQRKARLHSEYLEGLVLRWGRKRVTSTGQGGEWARR